MKILVNAGFGRRLSKKLANACQLVSEGVRTGIAVNDHHDWIDTVVGNVAGYFGTAVFIIGGWDWRREDGTLVQDRQADLTPWTQHLANQCESVIAVWRQNKRADEGLWIEIGNELDGSYWKKHLGQFHEVAMACYKRVRCFSKDVHVVTGSTMNFNKGAAWKDHGYEVLRDLCKFDWPADTYQGLHPYRQESIAWPSFSSDSEAFEALRRFLRGRGLAITEVGWRSKEGHSDQKIADMTRNEIARWQSFGAGVYAHYQIQDAPRPNNVGEGAYGLFTSEVEGLVKKPQADALMEALL